ncbi:DUF362 domain-containing protein [Candidatus Sumerlaeota bacterium]|nr:DUF362 domain-containing protein [Candidatus Sumerlaeota bacterium]
MSAPLARRTLVKRWAATLTGAAALVWFLIRVIPKPSRAAYPCQRAAFPIAAAFVMYLVGMSGAAVALRRARRYLGEARYVVASLCLVAMLACIVLTGDANPSIAGAEFIPPDPPNTPMGVARGIFPGRVTWAWDPDATYWSSIWNNSSTIFYWDDDHTSQTAVDVMVSKNLQWLTGETTDADAWDALFRYFNQQHGKGDVGYTAGEKVYVKPNHVQQRAHDWNNNRPDIVPQIELSMLKQLVSEAGVAEADITFGDASRYIADKVFNRCDPVFPDVHYGETTFYTYVSGAPLGGTEGRELLTSTPLPVVHYSNVDDWTEPPSAIPDGHIPQICVDADYIVNLGVMKGHSDAGVTLSGKNWYGCFGEPPGGGAGLGAAHHLIPDETPEPDHYRLMVDLMGHKDLGEKTVLYVLEGLWGFRNHGSSTRPSLWAQYPFNGDYPSSVLMSQDTVAIDSVGTDFLRQEFAADWMNGGVQRAVDDYLHEAALAYNAPSGTVYDPEGDATPCPSLGVHEHWTDSTSKTYTRNLSASGIGIELINYDLGLTPVPDETPTPGPDTGVAHWEIYR